MLISLRISSASIRDKLPLQPPDGNELKMMFSTTSGLHAFTNLKSTKKKYRLPPGMVTVTWNLTCSFSKTKLKNLLLTHAGLLAYVPVFLSLVPIGCRALPWSHQFAPGMMTSTIKNIWKAVLDKLFDCLNI